MYGLLYECKFLTIEETNKKKKKIKIKKKDFINRHIFQFKSAIDEEQTENFFGILIRGS